MTLNHTHAKRAPRALLLAVVLPVCLLSPACLRAAITQVGNVTNMTTSADPTNGSTIVQFWINDGSTSTNSEATITAYADDVIRVRYYFYNIAGSLWDRPEPMIAAPLGAWPQKILTPVDQGSNYLIQTALLNIYVYKNPFHVDFQDRAGGYTLLQDDHLEFDPAYQMPGGTGLPSGISKLKCIKRMPPDQAYFGLGEYAGPSNRRGLTLQCWNNSSYEWGDGWNPLYMNMPFFYGVEPAGSNALAFAYGIFFNNPCQPVFKLGTQWTDRYSFEAGDGQMDYFFFAGGASHTMKSVADRCSQLTGRPAMLPKWALGYHLGRYSYSDQGWVQYLPGAAISNDIPLDAVYLDIDYMHYSDGSYHQLTFNSNFPDPAGMVQACASNGVKLIPNIEPGLSSADPLYGTAYGDLHFIKSNNGTQFQQTTYFGSGSSWFDWTSTPCRNWWDTNIATWFNQVGLAGIWNDLAEPEDGQQIPINGLLWEDGQYQTSDTRMQWSNERNYFGLREAGTSYGALRQAWPNRRPFVLIRSGTSGIQRYGICWSGDTAANWYYAQACIRLGMNTMISGQTYFGHDLGGFSGNVTGELITRWHEWGALLPFCRNHSGGDSPWPDGSTGREPWRFVPPNTDQDYCSLMRNNIKFRYQLMPYLYTLMYNAASAGAPMNAPAFFDFFADENTWSQNEFDFMCGDWLLAAPVYTQGATNRTVYLPAGANWYFWPTIPNWPRDARYIGGQTVTVPAPLGTLALFIRSDAIIPMGPPMQYANQFQPGYLDINCWPESNSTFTLYEDAGEGWDFTNGVYSMTTYTSARTSSNWNFTVSPRAGSYVPYSPGPRTNNIYVYNPQAVQDVLLNGAAITNQSVAMFNAPLPCWFTTADGKLAIRVLETANQLQSIHVDWSTAPDPYASMTAAGPFNGWNAALNNMQLVAANTWQANIPLNSSTDVSFLLFANGGTNISWGDSNQSQFSPPMFSSAQQNGAAVLLNGPLTGVYQFTFNDQTLAYSVVRLTASPYNSMTVAGSFNGWNQALNNMQLVSNNTWQCLLSLTNAANVQFKFVANGNWNSNWGDTNLIASAVPFSGAGILSAPTNILVAGTLNGRYQFTFNDQSLQYTLQALPADSVGDGIPDSWRAQYFSSVSTNGTTTNAQSCAACDADGTGQNNYFKYVTGLDPTNPASVFILQIAPVAEQPGEAALTYSPITTGRTYTVQFTLNLPAGVYSNLTTIGTVTTNATQVTVTDTNVAPTNEFYRVTISSP